MIETERDQTCLKEIEAEIVQELYPARVTEAKIQAGHWSKLQLHALGKLVKW